jgi:glycosyltransferase involved in cell wall biosynthesis
LVVVDDKPVCGIFAMRIAFLDPSGWQYSVDTPYERPFGGSQSAICYLAVELARLGQRITIFNANASPTQTYGVELRNISEAQSTGYLNSFDAVVVVNAAIGRLLQRDVNVNVPLVFWNQHSHDQPAVQELSRLFERKSWTGFAFVSEWQLGNFERTYRIPREKSRVMRNAVSPAFAHHAVAPPWFSTDRPPTLFYSSTPFRGLDVLLQAFPTIRAAVPGARLRVFSSMAVYQVRPEDDKFRELYQRARQVEGVEYIGSVGQARLAQEIAGAAALAYPSTFAETSCMTALEAMAVGAAVFTTRLGALPETTNGLASMIEWRADKSQLAKNFATMAIVALRDMQRNPVAASTHREARIKFVNDNYTWPARAKEWIEWLSQLGHGQH